MPAARIAAIVLAAGRASRFGSAADTSKVYALLEGRALVAHAVAAARAGGAAPVIVVTGHAGYRAAEALRNEPPDVLVCNPHYASGLASSLRAGIAALPADADGALAMLADMPLVSPSTLAALVRRFDEEPCDAVVPSVRGETGNPVLLARSLFAAVLRLDGDAGARRLLAGGAWRVLDCPVDDEGILLDVDTTDALGRLTRR